MGGANVTPHRRPARRKTAPRPILHVEECEAHGALARRFGGGRGQNLAGRVSVRVGERGQSGRARKSRQMRDTRPVSCSGGGHSRYSQTCTEQS